MPSKNERTKERALLACKRRCCLCEKHVHTLVECHHIVQEADSGDNSFDNSIPLGDYSAGRLILSNHHFPSTAFHVWTLFHGSPWTDLLSEMNIGTHITLQVQMVKSSL